MNQRSIIDILSSLVQANAELARANRAEDLGNIDGAAAELNYQLTELCKAFGLDKGSLERNI